MTTTTTLPNHTSDADDAKLGARPTYKSYGHYARELDRHAKPYLWDQRDILCSIVFDRDGHTLMKSLTPAAFSQRNYADFNDEKGTFQLLAETAFAYWEQYGAPPREAIYDLVASLPERVLHLAQRMERKQRELEATHVRELASHKKRLARHDDRGAEGVSKRARNHQRRRSGQLERRTAGSALLTQ